MYYFLFLKCLKKGTSTLRKFPCVPTGRIGIAARTTYVGAPQTKTHGVSVVFISSADLVVKIQLQNVRPPKLTVFPHFLHSTAQNYPAPWPSLKVSNASHACQIHRLNFPQNETRIPLGLLKFNWPSMSIESSPVNFCRNLLFAMNLWIGVLCLFFPTQLGCPKMNHIEVFFCSPFEGSWHQFFGTHYVTKISPLQRKTPDFIGPRISSNAMSFWWYFLGWLVTWRSWTPPNRNPGLVMAAWDGFGCWMERLGEFGWVLGMFGLVFDELISLKIFFGGICRSWVFSWSFGKVNMLDVFWGNNCERLSSA